MAGATQVKKVGQGAAKNPAEPKVAKEPKVRVEFDIKTSTNADGARIKLDDAGRLTAVPANYEPKLHKPLGKKHFATKALLFDFQVGLVDRTIAKLQERREALIAKKAGKETSARKLARLEKLKAQLAELETELKDSGVQM